MRTSTRRLVIWCAAAVASGAAAQSGMAPPPIEAGRVVEGHLDRAEVRHGLRLRSGETVRIAARSRAFDPMLKLYAQTGSEPLAQDDDSGGGTTAELTFSAPTAGTYLIGVSVSGSDEAPSGRAQSYDLSVVAATAPVLAPPRPITPNTDRPTPIDAAQCGDGCRFTFQANQGDRLTAETSADEGDADPVLELYRGAEKIAEDDDGGEGSNARIIRQIDRAGSYTLLARSYQSHGGTYALNVALRPHTAHRAIPLAIDTPTSGRLTTDAEISDAGRYYDVYTLHGRAGQRLVIDMTSTDFDTVVELWGQTILGPTLLASNDDADASPGHRATSTNSHLAVTFGQDGDIELRALSLNNQGAYTLRAGEQPAR